MKRVALLLFLAFGFTFLSAQDSVMVTFQVNMKVQLLKGVLIPADDYVSVNGDFNGWTAGTNKLTDDDADSVYTGEVKIAASSSISYKFFIGGDDKPNGGWESIADNRSYSVGTTDAVIPAVWYNDEEMPSGNPFDITFNVDMRLVAKQGFDPVSDTVKIAGSFTDWGTNPVMMTDVDGDSVYTVTQSLNSGQNIAYKYIYISGTTMNWESVSDRKYWVSDMADTISQYWNDVDPNVTLATGAITFNFDTQVLQDLNLFDPVTDSVQIRGSFNGWANTKEANMQQNFLAPTQYFKAIDFINQELNASQTYKYYVKVVDQEGPLGGDQGYERPFGTGGGDRETLFEGVEDQQVPVVYFGDILPGYVIESGKNLSIKFRVDMTDAANASIQGPNAFVPGTDTVYWVPQQALFASTQGMTEGQNGALMLTDDNSDMVYEGTLNITAPSFNGFMYIYQYTHADSYINETTALGTSWSRRVRYIPMTGDKNFGVYESSTYEAPVDSWSNSTDKTEQSETAPEGYVSVKSLNDVAGKFDLSQNYPNPFNPTTKIKFSVPATNQVSLRIYNALGQLVETLVNNEMNSGSYEVSFNASSLSSGVYFYQLRTGSYSSVKKMMLIK